MKVVRLALLNAASVAGMLITTQVLVIDEPERRIARADSDDFTA